MWRNFGGCQELGMGKSWVYRRLRSGEIPSVTLGRLIKVRREELEEYLEKPQFPPATRRCTKNSKNSP